MDANELKNKDYYKPSWNRDDAEKALKDKPPGSFFLRASSKPNSLALSYKTEEGKILHSLIEKEDSAYKLPDHPRRFGNIDSLLRSCDFLVVDRMDVPPTIPQPNIQQQNQQHQLPQQNRYPPPIANISFAISEQAKQILIEAFPNISKEVIENVLIQTKNDANHAIDILLSGVAKELSVQDPQHPVVTRDHRQKIPQISLQSESNEPPPPEEFIAYQQQQAKNYPNPQRYPIHQKYPTPQSYPTPKAYPTPQNYPIPQNYPTPGRYGVQDIGVVPLSHPTKSPLQGFIPPPQEVINPAPQNQQIISPPHQETTQPINNDFLSNPHHNPSPVFNVIPANQEHVPSSNPPVSSSLALNLLKISWDKWSDYSEDDTDWARILIQMKESLLSRTQEKKKVPNSVSGMEIIDWLLDNTWVRTRSEAEEIGLQLVSDGLLEPVDKKKHGKFKDSDKLLVLFGNLELLNKRNASRRAISIQDFEILKVLGKGAFATVFLVEKKSNKKLYAMKQFSKDHLMKNPRDFDLVLVEKEVLLRCTNCSFIENLHFAFQSEDSFNLIIDLLDGGEVFSHLMKKGHFNEKATKLVAAESILMVEYLHSKDIIHRDIKPHNMLFDVDGHLCLADFNFCDTSGKTGWNEAVGTPVYMAPEVYTKRYGKAIDWWSLGIVLYELLAGYPPFDGYNMQILEKTIRKGLIVYPENFSSEAIDFLKLLLEKDETKRIDNVKYLKTHPFLKEIDWDLLKKKKLPGPLNEVVHSSSSSDPKQKKK